MGGSKGNIILAVILAALVVSGTYAAYSNLVLNGDLNCLENEELISGLCQDTDAGDGDGNNGSNGGSGTHFPSEQDCTNSQVWRDESCQTMLPPSDVSYGENSFQLILGQMESVTLIPTFSGDSPDSWAVTPNLPNGIHINPINGMIEGTPLEEFPATEYTVVASNIVGSSSTIITFSAVPNRPLISLPSSSYSLVLGVYVTTSPPQIDRGPVDSWSVEPPLPPGLTLNYQGAITGRPQALGTTIHSLEASNFGGITSRNFSITVDDTPANNLQYFGSPFTLTINSEIDTIPPIIGGGAVTSWEVEPSLPLGLEFNNSNGWISGIPSSLNPMAFYTVWANNSGGSHSSAIQIAVVDELVSGINYLDNSIDVAWNAEMVNRTPLYFGGTPLAWGISPLLPSGLAFNTSNGQISGIASELRPWANYTVWANNSGGSGLAFIALRVADQTPVNISWNGTQFAFASNESLHIEALNLGPTIDTWEISPSLPVGVIIDQNGNITGTPIYRSSWEIYTIWANNTGGSFTTNISLAIHDLDADWSDITAGVGSVDYGSSWPSLIVPIGEWAFPIGLDWDDRPIISANHVGRGKIAGYGHESMVARTTGSEATLSLNVVRWVCGDGLTIALESGFNSWADELQAEGYSVTTSATPDDLVGQACFVGAFWNGWDDNQDRKIEQFLLNGGGVILGGHSWYWSYSNSDVAHNYPGNQISKISGLFVSASSGSVSLSFPNENPSPYFRTRDALFGVESHLSTGPLLNQSNSVIAAGTISRVVSNLPLDFDLFWNPVRLMTNNTGWIQISSSNTFTLGSDPIDDLILNVQEQLMLQLPADELVAHPSAVDFPGEVPAGSVRVTRSMTLEGNFSGLPSQFGYAGARSHGRMGTGLYAAPGEVVNVTVPQTIVGQNVYILIGAHSDSLWGKTSLSRHPKVVRWWPVDNVSMQVGNAFGGVIYLAIPAGSTFGSLNLSIENAVEMPRYIHGQTSISDWRNTIRNFSAPYAELESDYFILTVPSKDIRTLDDPDHAMNFWSEALQMEHNLSGFVPWPRVERAVFDVQISAGWMHSGYPFMAHHASVAGVVNGTKMYQDGDWGMFHELGHNHQWGSATLPGTTETTCNLYSVKLMTDLVGKDLRAGHSALNTNSANSRIETYFNNGAHINSWSVWTALETYLQIQEEFGWEPITAAFQEYYYNYSSQPSGSSNEFNQYAIQISLNTGHNLVPFLEAWGFPITQTTRDAVNHLPVWVTDPLRGWVHDYDPQLRSLGDSNVSSGNADLTYEIYDNGTDVNLTVCWGLVDGGMSTVTWSNCQSDGVASVGWSTVSIGNLTTGQTYYWRVMGENQNGQTWTSAATFLT